MNRIKLGLLLAYLAFDHQAIGERIASLGAGDDPAMIASAHEAQASIRWCLDWTAEQRSLQQAS